MCEKVKFTNQQKEEIEYWSISVIDSDTVVQNRRIKSFTIPEQEVMKHGFNDPNTVREYTSKPIEIQGIVEDRWNQKLGVWLPHFKGQTIILKK